MNVDASWQVAFEHDAQLGEGPSWDHVRQELLWVDMRRCEILRSNPGTGLTERRVMSDVVGAIVPREQGGYLFTDPQGFWTIGSFEEQPELLTSVEAGVTASRMNDGKCDLVGRMWSGSMFRVPSEGSGILYRLGPDRSVEHILEPVTIPNGIAFARDGVHVYFIDTALSAIDELTFDGDRLVSRRTLADLSQLEGSADGMTVDEEGCLWVAFFRGDVCRFSPNGDLDRVLELPVSIPTSVAFGGRDLDTLYVTTAAGPLSGQERTAEPLSGSVLALDVGVKGFPEVPYRLAE
ncbi:MAG: araB 2 [Subtercola sp.]|nr:araB 2 [Subtercola sp.]